MEEPPSQAIDLKPIPNRSMLPPPAFGVLNMRKIARMQLFLGLVIVGATRGSSVARRGSAPSYE
jgi:hypothetical protein